MDCTGLPKAEGGGWGKGLHQGQEEKERRPGQPKQRHAQEEPQVGTAKADAWRSPIRIGRFAGESED